MGNLCNLWYLYITKMLQEVLRRKNMKKWIVGLLIAVGLWSVTQEAGAFYTHTSIEVEREKDNGEVESLYFRQKPVTINGRILVEVKEIFAAYRMNVTYDNRTKKVTAWDTTNKIVLYVNNNKATVNGTAVTLDTSARIINGRTMVPIRFISEALNKDVSWEKYSNIIQIINIPPQKKSIVPDATLHESIQYSLGKEKLTKESALKVTQIHAGSCYYPPGATLSAEPGYAETPVFTSEGLNYFTKLKTLRIGCNRLKDLSDIKGLTSLTSLHIGPNGKIASLEGISKLTNLEYFGFEGHNIKDLSPLKNLTKLKKLELSSIDATDFRVIANLKNLEELTLTGVELKDLSFIENLVNLKKIHISTKRGYEVSSLESFAKLTELQSIAVPNSHVTKVPEFLTDFENLQTLNLGYSTLHTTDPVVYETIKTLKVNGVKVSANIYEPSELPYMFIYWSGEGYVNGKYINIGHAPYIQRESNRTMYPIRAVSENLGIDVEWNQKTKEIILTKGDKEVILTVNSEKVRINGVENLTDSVPEIKASVTYLPIRFVAEQFDYVIKGDRSELYFYK